LAYYLNDPEKTQREVNDPLGSRKSIVRALLASVRNKILAIFDARRRYNSYYRSLYSEKRWMEHQETFLGLEKTTRDRGIRLTVLICPEFHDFQDYQFLDIHEKVTGFFQSHGHLVLDLLNVFNGKEARQFWVARDDPHPNAKANQMIADFIFNKIKERF
jgi:hypothetical protein